MGWFLGLKRRTRLIVVMMFFTDISEPLLVRLSWVWYPYGCHLVSQSVEVIFSERCA